MVLPYVSKTLRFKLTDKKRAVSQRNEVECSRALCDATAHRCRRPRRTLDGVRPAPSVSQHCSDHVQQHYDEHWIRHWCQHWMQARTGTTGSTYA